MASRKGAKPKTKAQLKKLLKKAQGEVKKLLKEDKAAILTRAKLRAGLEEIKHDLVQIEPFEEGA
jgi:hypothetical protein